MGDSCQERSKDDDRAGLWVFLSFGIRGSLKPYSISSPHPWPLKTGLFSPVTGRRSSHTRSHLPRMPETEVSVPHIRISAPGLPGSVRLWRPLCFGMRGMQSTLFWARSKRGSWFFAKTSLEISSSCKLQTVSQLKPLADSESAS